MACKNVKKDVTSGIYHAGIDRVHPETFQFVTFAYYDKGQNICMR